MKITTVIAGHKTNFSGQNKTLWKMYVLKIIPVRAYPSHEVNLTSVLSKIVNNSKRSILFERLTVAQFAKKLSAIYEIQRSTTIFTKTSHRRTQSTNSKYISLRFISM
jgi:hypothetical protein